MTGVFLTVNCMDLLNLVSLAAKPYITPEYIVFCYTSLYIASNCYELLVHIFVHLILTRVLTVANPLIDHD